jgi:hypothetical protein
MKRNQQGDVTGGGTSTEYLEAKDQDGNEIKLLPDVINLFGLGFDVFDSNHISFPETVRFFREVQEQPMQMFYNKETGMLWGHRRFKLKLHMDWFLEGEDPEREFMASYFKDSEGNWVFRLDAYPEYYKDTPAANWIDW